MQKKSGKALVECIEKENIQAVVIADNFNDNFAPVTSSIPPCLMPLVNRPLLDYTLQCLCSASVQEVILFCSAYADQIKDFVRNGSWGRMTVTVVVSEGCRSLGDAMRDLDAKSLIRGDFILLTGDVVGNLKLIPALEKHKKFQLADKGTVMTLIYKECGRKLKSLSDDFTIVTDMHSNRMHSYFKNISNRKKIDIPLEIILDRSDLNVRCDLMDTGVAICSVAVPPLFSDNFDFQTMDDFIRGLLMNDEILESSVYCYYLPNAEYAASATSWHTYHSISHDIMHRWTYPQVPDTRYDEVFSFKRQNVYLQPGVSLARGCSIPEDTVIGRDTSIAEKVTISSTVIGKGCKISESTTIVNSHLLDNVLVKDGCKISYCVLGEGSIVGSNVTLDGCILGPGVVIEKGANIQNKRLQSTADEKGEKESFGPKAFVYRHIDDFDSDSDSEAGEEQNQWKGLKIEGPHPDDEGDESSESEDEMLGRDSPLQDDTNLFFNEVVDSLVRGYEEKITCDNLVLEVNSSRYAYNVTVREVNYYLMRAILSLENNKKWESLLQTITYFIPLLRNYFRNADAMMDCLTAIEDIVETDTSIRAYTVKLLHFLYNKDLLTEESILTWHKKPRENSGFGIQLRKQVAPFIQWLEEADEQSSSEEE